MNIKLALIVTVFLVLAFGKLEIVYAQQSPPKETRCQQSAKEILTEIDTIYGLSAASDKVLVAGEVYAAQLLANEEQLSLTQALATVGGLSKNSRHLVYLLRQAADTEAHTLLKIDLREIKMGRTKDILLEKGDVVFVSRRCFNGKRVPFTDTLMKPLRLTDAPIRFSNVPFAQKRYLEITPHRTIRWT